jgi:hypothetical protein
MRASFTTSIVEPHHKEKVINCFSKLCNHEAEATEFPSGSIAGNIRGLSTEKIFEAFSKLVSDLAAHPEINLDIAVLVDGVFKLYEVRRGVGQRLGSPEKTIQQGSVCPGCEHLKSNPDLVTCVVCGKENSARVIDMKEYLGG